MNSKTGPEILYSIVVPAYNEEEHLPECLNQVRNAMASVYGPGEVIVVDNNSTDRSAAIAGELGARVVFEEHRQIAAARNCGAAVARGKYLIFVDADTLVSGELLRVTLEKLESGKCAGGGAMVRFNGNIPRLSRPLVKAWNCLSRLAGLAAGCYVFARRELFEEVGGFSTRLYAGEELTLSRQLKIAGRKRGLHFIIITNPLVLTSSRKTDAHSSLKLLSVMFLLGIFPFLRRNKKACFLWYGCRHRDDDSTDKKTLDQ